MEQIPKEMLDAMKDADVQKEVTAMSKALDIIDKAFKNLIALLIEAFKELERSAGYAVSINIGYTGTVVKFAAYYGMAVLGMKYAIIPDRKGALLILLVPMFVQLFAFILCFAGEKMHPRKDLPIPLKRFTQASEDGVTVDRDRLNELLLYVADVEDYLERHGKL